MEASPKPPEPFVPPTRRDMAQRAPSSSETVFPESKGTKLNLHDSPRSVEEGAATTAPTGAFLGLYDNSGHTYLQGGGVTGGNGGSATIADEKVLDSATGVMGRSGQILYLQANVSATVTDGIMLPGCTLNSASLTFGASVPDNHTFTTTSKNGNIYVEIGRWTDDSFLPSGPAGNFLASGCIGNFSLSKA